MDSQISRVNTKLDEVRRKTIVENNQNWSMYVEVIVSLVFWSTL